jgi:hypothetical protein
MVVGSGVLKERSVSAELIANFAIGDTVRVFDGPVNFRAAPGLSAPIAAVAPDGDLVLVLDGPVHRNGCSWVKVLNDYHRTGWMAAEFLTYDSGGYPSEGDPHIVVGDAVRVADGPVNFRAEPGLGARILDVVDEAALFVVRDGPVTVD